jgi:tubulin polyglutamylase TTLL6/13
VIVKPDGGCQGKGIVLTNDPTSQGLDNSSPSAVAQVYLEKPFLIDGFKFDMRVYVLVTSIDPLRVYLYDEGIARFCTTPYLR